MRPAILAVLIFGACVQPLFAGVSDVSQKVDRIFAAFDRPGSPGCSLGVIRDREFIYRKSYGEASLELGVPLSSQSVFYVGSISKQFTAASVVLAAEQGQLSLDDDVRKYIPELPDYGHKITLREMLNQTSGLRDFFDLIYFSGRNSYDFNSPGEILQLIERQRGLNNVPGAEWVYSNTNYFLLGIVLQRATGKTLAEFAKEKIFQPLGMTHTRFYDDASVVAPGRVAAYDAGEKSGFRVDWSTSYAIVGGGGLMTTVGDLLRWDDNFYSNRLGRGTLLKELETRGILNDDKRTTYGMGLILGNYRGLPIVEHNGALFGYRADLLRFPDQKFTVITLCNVSSAEPELRSREVAEVYLKSEMSPGSFLSAAAERGFPDPATYAGDYLDRRTHTVYSFTAKDGRLQGWGSALRRKDASQYYDLFGDVITFEGSEKSMKATLDLNGEKYFAGEKVKELAMQVAELKSYAGDYRSTELKSEIHLSMENGKLTLGIGSNPPAALMPVAKDEFVWADGFSLIFHRDAEGKVSGLSVYEQAARGMEFERVN